MAITHGTFGIPSGKWVDDKRSHYWLTYRRFGYFDDASGNEIIKLRQAIKDCIGEARDKLAPHDIEIINVATQEFVDIKNFGNTIGVAIAFKSLEDKAMATILLDCQEDKFMI